MREMVILAPGNNTLQPHSFQRAFINRIRMDQKGVGIVIPNMFPEMRVLNDLSRVTQLRESAD